MTIKNRSQNKYVFSFLAIGFTFISAYNGYNFYRIILGLSVAVLITVVFEVGRIASLFRLVNSGKRKTPLAVIMYIIIATVCTFASINSFTTDIISKGREGDKYFNEQISNIKEAYSKKMESEFVPLKRDIKYLENKVAKYHKSDYWKRRLSQIVKNYDKKVMERDKFMNTFPEDPDKWIKANSPLLSVNLKEEHKTDNELISVKIALKEIWGLESIQVQKLIGIVLTIAIELLILLLATLSVKMDTEKEILANSDLLNSNFEQRSVNKFIELNKDHFRKTGKLLPQSKLNSNLRPIRLFLKEFDNNSLKELFQKT